MSDILDKCYELFDEEKLIGEAQTLMKDREAFSPARSGFVGTPPSKGSDFKRYSELFDEAFAAASSGSIYKESPTITDLVGAPGKGWPTTVAEILFGEKRWEARPTTTRISSEGKEKKTRKSFRLYFERLGAGALSTAKPRDARKAGTKEEASGDNYARTQCGIAALLNKDAGLWRGKTLCWLCGCPIRSKSATEEEEEAKASSEAECEHILPALRAIMLKGLFNVKDIMVATLGAIPDAKLLEWCKSTADNYLWAHSKCNASKGGDVLIKYDERNLKFIVDDDKCIELAGKIDKIVFENNFKPKPRYFHKFTCYSGFKYKEKKKTITRGPGGKGSKPIQYAGKEIESGAAQVYEIEMNHQILSINTEWMTFLNKAGDDSNLAAAAFCQYALLCVKLVLNSNEDSKKLLKTDEEIARDKRAAEKAAAEEKRKQVEIKNILMEMGQYSKIYLREWVKRGIAENANITSPNKALITTQCKLLLTTYVNFKDAPWKNIIDAEIDSQIISSIIFPEVTGGTGSYPQPPPTVALVSTVNVMCMVFLANKYGWDKVVDLAHPTTYFNRRDAEGHFTDKVSNKFSKALPPSILKVSPIDIESLPTYSMQISAESAEAASGGTGSTGSSPGPLTSNNLYNKLQSIEKKSKRSSVAADYINRELMDLFNGINTFKNKDDFDQKIALYCVLILNDLILTGNIAADAPLASQIETPIFKQCRAYIQAAAEAGIAQAQSGVIDTFGINQIFDAPKNLFGTMWSHIDACRKEQMAYNNDAPPAQLEQMKKAVKDKCDGLVNISRYMKIVETGSAGSSSLDDMDIDDVYVEDRPGFKEPLSLPPVAMDVDESAASIATTHNHTKRKRSQVSIPPTTTTRKRRRVSSQSTKRKRGTPWGTAVTSSKQILRMHRQMALNEKIHNEQEQDKKRNRISSRPSDKMKGGISTKRTKKRRKRRKRRKYIKRKKKTNKRRRRRRKRKRTRRKRR